MRGCQTVFQVAVAFRIPTSSAWVSPLHQFVLNWAHLSSPPPTTIKLLLPIAHYITEWHCFHLLKPESHGSPWILPSLQGPHFQCHGLWRSQTLKKMYWICILLSNMIIFLRIKQYSPNLSSWLQPHLPSIYYPHCKVQFLKGKLHYSLLSR